MNPRGEIIKALSFVLLLFFCSAKAFAGKSCLDLIKPFFATESAMISSSKEGLSNNIKSKLLKKAKKLEFDNEQIEALTTELDSLKKKAKTSKLEGYLLFIETLPQKKRIKAIQDMSEIDIEDSKSKFVRKFLKIQKKVDKKYDQELINITKKLKEDKPGASIAEINRLAKRDAGRFRVKYEKLAYGCKSTKWTPERKAAAKSFKKFVVGIGLVSSVGAYSYQNRDLEKDFVWFGRLAYEMSFGTLVKMATSKIISNPKDAFLKKGLKRWLLSRTTGLIDMGIYGMLFGASESEAQAKLETLLKDPNRKEELEELQKAMEDKRIFNQIMDELIKNLRPFAGSIGLKIDPTATEHIKDVDWSNLTDEDLDREDVQEVLLAGLLIQAYEENKGNVVQTGHVGADRYSFHATYGLMMMPKSMAVSLYIYDLLCMGALNPQAALAKAVGLYTIDRLIFDQVYYFIRRHSINQ